MFGFWKKKDELYPKELFQLWKLKDISSFNSIMVNKSLKNYKFSDKFPYHIRIEILIKEEDKFHNNSEIIEKFDDYVLNSMKDNNVWIHFLTRLTVLWSKDYGFIRIFNFYVNEKEISKEILSHLQKDENFSIQFWFEINTDKTWSKVQKYFNW